MGNILRSNPKDTKRILYDLCPQVEDAMFLEDEYVTFFEEGEDRKEGKEEREVLEAIFERLQGQTYNEKRPTARNLTWTLRIFRME